MPVGSHKILFTNALITLLALSVLSPHPFRFAIEIVTADEICDNAIDDDGDGLIDLNDPDCICEIIKPVSLIPNPSFEDMDCCPVTQSQLDCASVWIQASDPTTDFIHMCNWMGWPEFPPPVPFPDGEGIMGFRDGRVRPNESPERFWKEYAGACLLSPLIADTPYVFEFYVGFVNRIKSPDINITFFGTTDCANLPFGIGNEAFGCPTNDPDWVRLGSSFVKGGISTWMKTSIEVTPTENITAIAIGPDCPPVNSPVSIYYFFDNLTLADRASFQSKITEVSHPCSDDFKLKVPEEIGFTYQWYKDGIALVGETSPQLKAMHGEGNYQVRMINGLSCSLTDIYQFSTPVITDHVVETICDGEFYSLGDKALNTPGFYTDTLKTKNNCDSIVTLDLEVAGITTNTVNAKIFEGETYKIGNNQFNREGEYLVTLISSDGCDSLINLHLKYYQVYIPNVFSPNGDGVNDIF
ncbi:MAG TPA: hypothetical protein VMZ69_11420, partial [Saprospiraceae bacterium]|nr:hypothetical protein [Saprospiraceae bacterium]